MRTRLVPIALLAALAPACRQAAAPATPPAATAAASPHAAEVARAQAVFAAIGKSLTGRLEAALAQGGPVQAIDVCRVEALPLTAAAVGDSDIAAGRTSHKLRNPANTPRPWLRDVVAAGAGQPAASHAVQAIDLGDKVGVAAPIPTKALCLTCHGDDTAVAPATRAALAAAYPADQARGFREGELRGWFWAEVPKAPRDR